MEEIRVGFIGVGGQGQQHLKGVQQHPHAKIVAVSDVNAELSRAIGAEYGANSYTDHHDMLEKEKLDALYVVIPPFAHSDAEVIAAKEGIHLFVEKPVALTMAKAKEVQAAINEAGVISSVGYTLRYFASPTRLREYFKGKTIGMVVSTRWGGVPGISWWRVMARSGGQLVEQTTHQVDLVRYMTGKEITSVYADYALRVLGDWEGLDIPDVYSICMKLEDGTPFSLTTSCVMYNGGGASDMNFLMDGYRIDAGLRKITTLPEANPEIDGAYGPDTDADIDAAFIDAIRLGDRSLVRSDYNDAVKTLVVTLAANESAATGEPVKLIF